MLLKHVSHRHKCPQGWHARVARTLLSMHTTHPGMQGAVIEGFVDVDGGSMCFVTKDGLFAKERSIPSAVGRSRKAGCPLKQTR